MAEVLALLGEHLQPPALLVSTLMVVHPPALAPSDPTLLDLFVQLEDLLPSLLSLTSLLRQALPVPPGHLRHSLSSTSSLFFAFRL